MRVGKGTGNVSDMVFVELNEKEDTDTLGIGAAKCFSMKTYLAKRLYKKLGKYFESQTEKADIAVKLQRAKRAECDTTGCIHNNLRTGKCMTASFYRVCPDRELKLK